ncbi:MAG: PAS domain S-box protein [Caulobacteraceae bacterium]|nr:PAS domain S-box protein [Caulobacteraceae bacterium]
MSKPSTFPAGAGEAAERIRAFDWSRTSLGPIAAWPQSLRTVVETLVNTPIAMVLMWGDDHVMLYNDGYIPIAGDKHPQALGGTVPGIWPEIWDWNRPLLERGFAGESMSFREQPLRIDRGRGLEDVWFDLFYTPVRDESGQVRGVLCTAPDITEQLRARGVERLHRQIVDGASDTAIVSTDTEGRITRWSAGATHLLGWNEAEMRGQSLARLFPDGEDGEARLAEERKEALARGRGGHEGWRRRKDGARLWAIGEMTPLRDEAGGVVGFVKVLSDRTAQKRAQEDLRDLNATLEQQVAERTEQLRLNEEALRQAQKMEAVGQLTGGIAHDFNNLLTGIAGGLDMIQRRIAQGRYDDLDRFMEAASASANRAAGLTQRLLAFSRRQSLDVKPVDVNQLVASMEDLLARTLGEQVQLEMAPHPGLWTAETDANQLETALLNLSINARDAMPEGGKLIVETSNATVDETYAAKFDDLEPGDFVVLCVSDTGAGMSPEVAARAFDPFFTTKPLGSGTGLGLSMVYGFVRQSKGHVRIYSQPGEGTTVKLFLPRFQGAVEAEAAEPPPRELPAGEGEVVLVVEDEAAVRLLITEVLEELGYRAIVAEDGDVAVAQLLEGGRIDLIVTDVGLPGVNGRQVAEIARQLRGGVKVLFVTGYAENAAVRGGFLEPGMEMITKPFNIDTLAAKIREMLS